MTINGEYVRCYIPIPFFDLNTKAQLGTHPFSDPAWRIMSQEPVNRLKQSTVRVKK